MSDSDKAKGDPVGAAVTSLQAVRGAAGQIGEQAGKAGAQAVDHAQDVAQDAQARAASLAGEVKGRLVSTAETQKGRLADQLEDVAQAVHRSGEQLEGHQDWIAGLVERGADELGTFAKALRTNDLQGIISNVSRLAREQPALFAAASLAAGFGLVRVGRVAASGAASADLPRMAQPSEMPDEQH